MTLYLSLVLNNQQTIHFLLNSIKHQIRIISSGRDDQAVPEMRTQPIFHKLNIEYEGGYMMPLFRSIDEGVPFAQLVRTDAVPQPCIALHKIFILFIE